MTSEAQKAGAAPLKLLLIEDNPGDARLFRAILSDGEGEFEADVRWEASLQAGLAAAREQRPDLVVVDLGLPDADGLDSVRRVTRRLRDVPVVVLTGRDDPELGPSAVREGAQDYLRKGELGPRELAHTLQYALLRSRTDWEIRRREQHFRALLSNVSDVISIVGPDGMVLYESPSAKRILGYEPEELEGENILEYFHPEDREWVQGELERLAATPGEERVGEARFRHADGSWRVLGARARMPPENTDIDGAIITSRDVTERVEHERALAERVKEQFCLYDVSRLLHEGERPLAERLQAVVDRIPAGWQYPEVAAAKVEVEGRRYASAGIEEVDQRLAADLEVEGERVGELVVGYREERPEEELGPFLIEERTLLEELAIQIQTEVGRQEIRRRMRHVVETMTEAVRIVAPDGTITFTNSAARGLYGDPDADYVGKDLTDYAPQVKTLDGAPHPPEELPFQTVLRTGEPVTGFEHLIEWDDGKRIAVSVNAAPIRDEDGEIRGVVLSTRNVTEQHRTAEWRHLLQSSVEAAAHGILITDREGEIVWANPAFTEMTGYSLREVEGETPRILQSGEQDTAFYEELWETILAGETWEGEIVNRRKDGTLYVERQSIVPIRHRSDEITHFIAVKEDVTEQKEQKERLRRSEIRHRTLVETMAEGTVLFDPNGRITFANEEAKKVLGLEASDIQGRTYDDPAWEITATGGGPIREDQLPFRRVLVTGRPVRNVEHGIERSDGTRRIISVNAAPLFGDDDELEGVVVTFRDVTERTRMEEELRHRALYDDLTGLPNRTLFWDRLEHALERSRRTGERLAVFFLDLDGFKRINDERGHGAGDEALRQVAVRLRSAIREADTLARLGGDEFGVLLEDLDDGAEADVVAGRLIERFDVPISVAGEDALVRVSCGIALAPESAEPEPVTADELVHRADRAMYAAKREPGSTFCRFRPEMVQEQTGGLRREIELKEALERGHVMPHFQPIVDLGDGRIVGAEALARWEHPERGLVSPGGFIPLAEETGLIVEMGRQVIRSACEQLATWRDEGVLPTDFRLHVNLSARELDRPEVVDILDELFSELDLDSTFVAFEVTETVAIKSAHVLERIREMGSPVAVDDFGTGYATLERLASLELDCLKLDRLFVDRIGMSSRHEAVLEASLTLAQAMGLSLVAEGVETEEQRAWLAEHGSRFAQGFFFAGPVPADEFSRWLRTSLPLPA